MPQHKVKDKYKECMLAFFESHGVQLPEIAVKRLVNSKVTPRPVMARFVVCFLYDRIDGTRMEKLHRIADECGISIETVQRIYKDYYVCNEWV